MDEQKEMAYAERFKAEDACYIRAEMEHGATQLVISGGPIAIPYVLMIAIRRTSVLTGVPFDDMIEGIKRLKDAYDRNGDVNIIPS